MLKGSKSKFKKCLGNSKMYLSKKKKYQQELNELMYKNEYEIDHFIDRYWFINCPDYLSISKIRDKVHKLIH